MQRARASVPPDAIRIEDEVWQEAFRERTRSPGRPRLRSLDGGRATGPVRARTSPSPVAREASAPTLAPEAPKPPARPEPAVRRTVTITGRGAERNLWATEAGRRRPSRSMHQRAGFRPDRVAMWAVFLGLLLVFVAAFSAHA